jgi:hypothetical protein
MQKKKEEDLENHPGPLAIPAADWSELIPVAGWSTAS